MPVLYHCSYYVAFIDRNIVMEIDVDGLRFTAPVYFNGSRFTSLRALSCRLCLPCGVALCARTTSATRAYYGSSRQRPAPHKAEGYRCRCVGCCCRFVCCRPCEIKHRRICRCERMLFPSKSNFHQGLYGCLNSERRNNSFC